MVLYEILNIIDSKRYVGITCDIKRRWREHRAELKSGKHHNKHLQAAWNLYGKILAKYINIKELKMNNPNLKNIGGIYRCCNKERKTAHGFKWSFTGGGLFL